MRCIDVWTSDFGCVRLDLDGDPPKRIDHFLQSVLDGGRWQQFRKFPPDVLAASLPRLKLAPQTRSLVEIWLEEAPDLVGRG
jgi:hypothetical protein